MNATSQAAPLSDVVASAPLPLTEFVEQFAGEAEPATTLPKETIAQKKAADLTINAMSAAASTPSYQLGSLLQVEHVSVSAMLAMFDGSAPSHQVPAAPNSSLVDIKELPETPATSLPPALVQAQEEVIIRVSKPEGPAKVASMEIKTPPPASRPQHKLTIAVTSREKVSFEPAVLTFDPKQKQTMVEVKSSKGATLSLTAETSLFVRNDAIVTFDEESMLLEAKAEGETEVYFVHRGKVHVLPVFVKRGTNTPELEVPEELFALSELNLSPHSAKYAKLAEPADALALPPETEDSASDPALVEPRVLNDFTQVEQPVRYVSADIKVVDQRSSRESSELFPLQRIKVKIAGLDYQGSTDRVGSHQINNLPANSRLLLTLDDPAGRVRPMIKEIRTGNGDQPLKLDIAMPLNRVMSTFEQVAGIVPNMNLATVCGSVLGSRSTNLPLLGIEVAIDVGADGPYYFNRFGYLDATQGATGSDGKYCFFNVEPGPVSVSLYEAGQFLSTQIASAHAGRYSDLTIYASEPIETSGYLAARVTAHEQLGGDRQLASSHKLIDMIDVIPLGTGQSMTYLDEGYVGVIGGAHMHDGRTYALAQASEFEPVLYPLNPGGDNVMPLLPRGFVDDMSIYAQVPYYPDLGVVVAEHGDLRGQGNQPVEFRLESINGESVGEGWYYDDKPTTKAIFFNLQPGQYILMVETQDGYWLAADTVYVFSETISYVRTGSPLIRK